ncbi:MAG TPA: hypothetical protein VF876_14575 [Burkholderiales bacterium]
MLRSVLKILIPAIALLLVGCRIAPVYDVNQAPVTTARPISMSDVEQAIRQAGASLGWQMVPKGPGNIEGTLILREHRAVVDIKYDTKTYSIKYKDSSNLQYDGASIHKNYNGWIQNLDNGIRARLTGL